MDDYGPATILINAELECLHFQGPTNRYLKILPGRPGRHVIANTLEDVRTKLRQAVETELRGADAATSAAADREQQTGPSPFRIEVKQIACENERLFLVVFGDDPARGLVEPEKTGADCELIAALNRELASTKSQLQSAIRSLQAATQQQSRINNEARSVNDDDQATNAELLASKEELQSLNEELTALNDQLQDTLERQRTTATDLQNVLYSTRIATIFLDTNLNIRLFTPAARAFFNVIPGDLGRPLEDLKALASDENLLSDARTVLETERTIEREVEGQRGAWFVRRALPYRTGAEKTEGVVITFEEVTERRRTADALAAARREAELASLAKSRFLAAASHDLRQPLQTLALLQGLMARNVVGEEGRQLIERAGEALDATTGTLNTLLGISQIEAGAVKAEIADFPVNDLFDRLRGELAYHAKAADLALRVIPCGLVIRTDRRLLEEMVRNLLSNALKYTARGKILVGCRRRNGKARIEVWDSGSGIPLSELQAIFEEYRQLDNPTRQRGRGLGLGLSIVRTLGELLRHPVGVRSVEGKGSTFSIEVPLAQGEIASSGSHPLGEGDDRPNAPAVRAGSILIIEDDPDVREHLKLFLSGEGYQVSTASDGPTAVEAVVRGKARPDLVLADYSLPGGMNGVQITQSLRRKLDWTIPVIILTGDISSRTLSDIALQSLIHLEKPVKMSDLTRAIETLLITGRGAAAIGPQQAANAQSDSSGPRIIIIDDDSQVREAIRAVLEDDGRVVESYASSEAFLAAYRPEASAFLLIDAYLPGLSGLGLLEKLNGDGHRLPAIVITGNGGMPIAVQAMRAGALDFIEKPISGRALIASIDRALELSEDSSQLLELKNSAAARIAVLTPRQREIMDRILAGHSNKTIAVDLSISQRTVEVHRAALMKRTGSKSLPALAKLAILAARA